MTTFNEADHPRVATGQFTDKPQSAPEVALPSIGVAPEPSGAVFAPGDFGPYTMKVLGSMQGREGEAFNAKLLKDGKVIAEVIQDGGGGEPFARFENRDVEAEFNQFVAENWNFPIYPGEHFVNTPHSPATVLDALHTETTEAAKLNRLRSRKTLSVLLPDDVEESQAKGYLVGYRSLPRMVDDIDAVAAELRRRGQLEGARYFDGKEWVPFPE